MNKPVILNQADQAVKFVLEKVGKKITLGIPLGLGKPNQFVNALYVHVANNPELSLRIITALSLEKPKASNEFEARLVNPLVERLFGNYEELEYTKALRSKSLPENIQVSEFYFKAGAFKHNEYAQRNYISANYTHVCNLLLEMGVNVVAQLVALSNTHKHKNKISLSCNTDILIDAFKAFDEGFNKRKRPLIVGQVHNQLPYMKNKAVVNEDRFDCIIQNPDYDTCLFSTPNQSVSTKDYAIAFHVSTLIKDGGTLQIGIGSLGDAIVHALKLRHLDNLSYLSVLKSLTQNVSGDLNINDASRYGLFEQGLYGASEMFINGFMHLIKAGIIKRKVYDHIAIQRLLNENKIEEKVTCKTLDALIEAGTINSILTPDDLAFLKHWGIFKDQAELSGGSIRIGQVCIENDLFQMKDESNRKLISQHFLGEELEHGIFMHGGFFLGPKDFYQALRDLPDSLHKHISMDSVGEINQLLFNPALKCLQRQHARFVNTAMMVTLTGAAVSDGLEDGRVISGIGGQYNFVAMAHDLPGARSIICVRSTRDQKGDTVSNILPAYGHTSIPRHLRDIVITEYGVADLRGKTDEEVAISLIEIADSRFQEELLENAQSMGKVSRDYKIPINRQNNLPDQINTVLEPFYKKEVLLKFPLGTDFTPEEIALMDSLKEIKSQINQPTKLIKSLVKSLFHHSNESDAEHFLERMQLLHPKTATETLIQHLLLLELEEKGYLKSI